MFDLIRERWRRMVQFFTGEEVSSNQDIAENTGTWIPVDTLSTSSVPSVEKALSYDLSRWTVTEYIESPFEKVGRLYVEGENLIIRSDLDTRGFRIRLVDVVTVLKGNHRIFDY